jgi:hypothetical protein
MGFKDLKGKKVLEYKVSDDELDLFCDDGYNYKLYHQQDCCELVQIEDIEGDLNDLINVPILVAEETTNHPNNGYESQTWTFYKLATIKGYITIRWLGKSNGNYSESVDFIRQGPYIDKLRDIKLNEILN